MRESKRAGFVVWATLSLTSGCGARTELETWQTAEDDSEQLLSCPPSEDPPLATATVGNDTELDGWAFAVAPIVRWQWSVGNEGCDSILPAPGCRLRGETAPRPIFNPARPGIYRIHLDVEALGGATAQCEFLLLAENEGLLVELCWDTSTTVDLDLYLHRPNESAPWCEPGASDVVAGLNSTTCNSANCAAELRMGCREWIGDIPIRRRACASRRRPLPTSAAVAVAPTRAAPRTTIR